MGDVIPFGVPKKFKLRDVTEQNIIPMNCDDEFKIFMALKEDIIVGMITLQTSTGLYVFDHVGKRKCDARDVDRFDILLAKEVEKYDLVARD